MSGGAAGGRRPFTAAELADGAALHQSPRHVLFQEIDAAGIVFFARFFDYFHDAFIEWMRAVGVDHAAALRARTWGAPLVHVEADYQAPPSFGDGITVEVCAARLGRSSLQVGYRVVGPRGIHAVGQTVHVFVSLDVMRSLLVPEAVRTALLAAAR